MSSEILMETSIDSMESVFRDLQSRDHSVLASVPVDKIKLKIRRQDGLIYLLSGTVDQKKKLLQSAQEMIEQLTSELNRKDAVVQQLKDEIGLLKTDKRGNSGKIHLLQYQLNKSKTLPLDVIEAESKVPSSPVPAVKSTTVSESPLTNRQAWLMHWRNSQKYRNSLIAGTVESSAQPASANNSICIEAVELDRSCVEDGNQSVLLDALTDTNSSQLEALSCTAMLSQAIADAPSGFIGSFDLSQLEHRMREYVDAQLQIKLLNMTSTSLPGSNVSPYTAGKRTPVAAAASDSDVISPIASDLSGSGHLSSRRRGRGELDVSSGKSFVLTTEKKSAPSSSARVHFSCHLTDSQEHSDQDRHQVTPPSSPLVDHNRSTTSSVSTTEYNDESRLSLHSMSKQSVNNKSSRSHHKQHSLSKEPKIFPTSTSLMMSDDSASTLQTTLNLTQIMNTSSVSPCVIRSLFDGFLADDKLTAPAFPAQSPIVVGNVAVSEPRSASAIHNRSLRSPDAKSVKSKVGSLVTVALTPDTTAAISPIRHRHSSRKSANKSVGATAASAPRTLASAVSRHSALSAMTMDESASHSPLRPTGFDFSENSSEVVQSPTAAEEEKQSVIVVNRPTMYLNDVVDDEDDEDGSVLTCYTLHSAGGASDELTSHTLRSENHKNHNRLIIPLTTTVAAPTGFRTSKAYRILPPSPSSKETASVKNTTRKSETKKRTPLSDVTYSGSSNRSENKKTHKTSPTSSVSDIDRLSAKDIIMCLSSSGGKKQQAISVTRGGSVSQTGYSSPKKVAPIVSPDLVAATPPSKVLQFLKAQASKLNQSAAIASSAAVVLKEESVKPTAAAVVPVSKPEPKVVDVSPSVPSLPTMQPSESVQDLHAFYQQQMQLQQQNMMQYFMQQMQQFATVAQPAAAAVTRSAPVEQSVEDFSKPVPTATVSSSNNRIGGNGAAASALLSPDSFRDHMSKFRRENDKIRSDINRFKGTIEKLRDENQPSQSARHNVIVGSTVVPKYSQAASAYSSVYV